MGLQDSRKRTHKEVVTVQLVLCQGTVLALGWKQVAACVGGEGSQKTLQCGRVGDGGEGGRSLSGRHSSRVEIS